MYVKLKLWQFCFLSTDVGKQNFSKHRKKWITRAKKSHGYG